jgi:hypothetical protein
VERELRLCLLAPAFMQERVMIFGVIADHDDSSPGTGADLTQLLEKLPKSLSVENTVRSGNIRPPNWSLLAL